ncbi:MAG: pepsin/retropepsin-like aspartic protease family protein [Candidatus Bipolaricaulota bacterium]|nr:pepsin/retropepsin-like aspartic protease family protein [Candidatus Bipolaricaulota bacterium]MDW8127321.1 pepsin/retropepsin-like aspartic protease family protein [Candidatus Bipolaricaulota bacterium]
MTAISLLVKALIFTISTEPMTDQERRTLEALKVAGAQVCELDWWEARNLVAEIAARGYQLKMDGQEVKGLLRFPVRGPLAAFSPLFKKHVNYVEASINGQEFLLLLDTGSPFTTLTPRSAVEQKLPISMEFRPKRKKIKHHSIPAFLGEGSIKVGQAEATRGPIIVTQNNARAKLLNIPIWHHTGTLGFDLLTQFSSVTIDYSNRAFVLRHPNLEYEPSAEAIKLPFRAFQFGPLVEVYLNGKGPFSFLFDTGASDRSLLVAPRSRLRWDSWAGSQSCALHR